MSPRPLCLGVEKISSVTPRSAAWHWGLCVGDHFYEVAGMGQKQLPMKVYGPFGLVAAAPEAVVEGNVVARNRTQYGLNTDGSRDRGGILPLSRYTTKADGEITTYIRQWVQENPKYTVFSCNCQHFCHAFYKFLMDGDSLDQNIDFLSISKEIGAICVGTAAAGGGLLLWQYSTSAMAACQSTGVCSYLGMTTQSQAAAAAAAAAQAGAQAGAVVALGTAGLGVAVGVGTYVAWSAIKPHKNQSFLPNLDLQHTQWRYDDINPAGKALDLPYRFGFLRTLNNADQHRPIYLKDKLGQNIAFKDKNDAENFIAFLRADDMADVLIMRSAKRARYT